MQEILFGRKKFHPIVRKLFEMKEVLYDKEWLTNAKNTDLYYMYRDLSLNEKDKKTILSHGLRYDITVILPLKLGKEFNKTAGHYHPFVSGTNLTYPEIYEVLEGEAHFLLQRISGDDVDSVMVFKTKKGDKVIIPPNFGHVTINPSGKVLKIANFVARDFDSLYDSFKRKKGAAYFELVSGKFIRNENYKNVELKFEKSSPVLGLKKSEHMYELIRKDPSRLDFLVRPQDFPKMWRNLDISI
jgi:glucose-6-phosphate isomerase